MSAPATVYNGIPREQTETAVLLAIIWIATVPTYLIARLNADLSTDDAMRLVEVRDLLGGQSWFDPTQYRLAPSEGVRMHWSRVIDLPLAALIRAGDLMLPAARAEAMAMAVWPAALLLVFLAGIARLALIFAALMAPVLQHFRPGAIDHHNAQLALLVWSLVFALRPQPRDAALAGTACALSIAIGVDVAPAIAVLAAAMAL